jgi:hypothetical protein
VRWTVAEIDAQVELCGDTPREALVQHLAVTDDAGAAYDAYAREVEVDAAVLAAAPYVLIGTRGEIAAKISEVGRRWGSSGSRCGARPSRRSPGCSPRGDQPSSSSARSTRARKST